MALSSGMMVLRAMVLGWSAYSPPSTSVCSIPPIARGGEGNDHLVGRKPPPPLFYSIATGFPSFQAPLCHRPTFRESVLSETRWIKKTHLLQRGCYLCLAPGLSQKWCHDQGQSKLAYRAGAELLTSTAPATNNPTKAISRTTPTGIRTISAALPVVVSCISLMPSVDK